MAASSSSLPPTRFFDRLPTETLSQIFADVIQDTLRTSETRKTHYKTLLSLCLVSKLFRSFAQPLLLKHVSLVMGSGPKLLERLLSNNSKEAVGTIENFYWDERVTKVIPLLKKFVKLASNLKQATVSRQVSSLKPFLGSNITTLSLHWVTMRLNAAVFFFPQLARLSMSGCPIQDGGIRFELPKLKHFVWLRHAPDLHPNEFDFINRLVPQLDSFMALLVNKPALPPSIYTLPSLSVLFKSYPVQLAEPTFAGVVNLHIPLNGELENQNLGRFEKELEGLDKWIQSIGTPGHQLETLTVTSLRESKPSNEALSRVDTLIEVCKEKEIKVIWDERGDGDTFYDLVPASFIRRVEALS
ncbi:uncharacterized protein JCM6883_007304 [Sporobolomyces salmoneus]|uniref:uncharacterized protein n=1 Tax=Sporobolomyces salmoneus TaxID=183962 RepID=UPI00317C2152